MSRLLLCGVGPLAAPARRRIHAPALRLETFARALISAGHQVLLGEFYFSGADDEFIPWNDEGVAEHRRLGSGAETGARQLAEWCEQAKPDALIALTDVGALAAARSGFGGPIWIDYFGHPMAERQQQAFAHGSNASLHGQWLDVLPALLRGDRFSGCSNSQRLAMLGELGAAGRLNEETCAREIVEILPPALPFDEPYVLRNPEFLLRKGIPSGARIILSTGGYNTWVDEETLFLAVEEALRQDEHLHFVSTGGAIPGHVEIVFEKFCERIEKSELRHRFHLLGWLPHEELINTLLLGDVGINCDRWSMEGELGCRNRLLDWLWAGLRVVTTVTSEPTRELADDGFVVAVKDGDWRAAAAAIVEQARLGRFHDVAARNAELLSRYAPEKVYEPLVRWAASPAPAPDRLAGDVSNPLADLQRRFLNFASAEAESAALREKAREVANTMLGSRAIRLYGMAHPRIILKLNELKKLVDHETNED